MHDRTGRLHRGGGGFGGLEIGHYVTLFLIALGIIFLVGVIL
jgi:hypothetical protein